jgi:hypothetical protein
MWVILVHADPDCTGDFVPATIPGEGAVIICTVCPKRFPASSVAIEAAERMRLVSEAGMLAQRTGAKQLGRWVTHAEEMSNG